MLIDRIRRIDPGKLKRLLRPGGRLATAVLVGGSVLNILKNTLDQWSRLEFLIEKITNPRIQSIVLGLVDGRVIMIVGFVMVGLVLARREADAQPRPEVSSGAPPRTGELQVPNWRFSKFVSRFANTEADLETVLALRRACFRDGVIVPDDTYRACWRRNHDTMKIVFNSFGVPLGYWSVIPIERASYLAFVNGQVSHHDMMANRCIPWSQVDISDAYIYVVGAVVPRPEGSNEKNLLHEMNAGYVMGDLYNFGLTMLARLNLSGICGYPTRDEGLNAFVDAGFVPSREVSVDGKKDQPVCEITPKELDLLKRHLMLPKGAASSVWEQEDKKRFLRELTRRRAGRSGKADQSADRVSG